MNTLSEHPRLYIDAAAVARARRAPRLGLLKHCAAAVERLADASVAGPDFEWVRFTHNAHLLRARAMQGRVVSLIAQWLRSGHIRYRDAAVAHIRAMGEWEYWSWLAWRDNNPDPDAVFDLSYGENSATLAIAYDLLHDTLSATERADFESIARRRALQPFLKHTAPGSSGAWWLGSKDCNWNSVCAGGAGMLALAMREAVPETATVLRRVERSIRPFMATLKETGGAWPEGIGYWNYGMRYAFMYLLSHQQATGRPHPTLERETIRATLRFPLDFTPHGIGCSFGDANHWSPLPFHYAAAAAMQDTDLIALLDQHMVRQDMIDGSGQGAWPTAAEFLFLHPGRRSPRPRVRHRVLTLYPHQDWGVIADQAPASRLYLTVRGGATDVPHGHRDLLSFHCVIGDEALLPSMGNGEYLDTTFTPRRWELPEMMPYSKNTIWPPSLCPVRAGR